MRFLRQHILIIAANGPLPAQHRCVFSVNTSNAADTLQLTPFAHREMRLLRRHILYLQPTTYNLQPTYNFPIVSFPQQRYNY